MIWSKPILNYRNKLASLAMEVDSCAMIETSRLTEQERETIKQKVRDTYKYIDEKLSSTRPK